MQVIVTNVDKSVDVHEDVEFISLKPNRKHWELTKADHILVIREDTVTEVLVLSS